MTSFFTIELDAFPFNEEGKMPLPTIVGIICKIFVSCLCLDTRVLTALAVAVSAGLSIPFIFIAFNLETVLKWTSLLVKRAKKARSMVLLMVALILVLGIALAVTLSQPLEAGIKAGVGIALGLLVAAAGLVALLFS